MKNLWMRFARDERGFVVSAELVLVLTVGVLSMLVGLQAVSSAITQELNDVANAFGAVSQSYGYRSIAKRRHAWISGSAFYDNADFCDCSPIVQTDVVGHTSYSHDHPWAPEGASSVGRDHGFAQPGPHIGGPHLPPHHDGGPRPGGIHAGPPHHSPHFAPPHVGPPGHPVKPHDQNPCCPEAEQKKTRHEQPGLDKGQSETTKPRTEANDRPADKPKK